MEDYFFMYINKTPNQKKGGKYVEFKARSNGNILKRVIAEMKAYRGVEARVAVMEWDDEHHTFFTGDLGVMRATPDGVFIWESSDANMGYRMSSGMVDPKTGAVRRMRR